MGVSPESAQRLKHLITTKQKNKCIVTTYNDFRGYTTNGEAKEVNDRKRLSSEDVGEIVVPVKNKKIVFDVPEFE